MLRDMMPASLLASLHLWLRGRARGADTPPPPDSSILPKEVVKKSGLEGHRPTDPRMDSGKGIPSQENVQQQKRRTRYVKSLLHLCVET